MSEKKELNIEELDKVTGGVNNPTEHNFKFDLGEKVEQVIINLGAGREDAATKRCTITKRAYRANVFGVNQNYYWLDVDGEKSIFSGWFGEDDLLSNDHNWHEKSEIGMNIVDQL